MQNCISCKTKQTPLCPYSSYEPAFMFTLILCLQFSIEQESLFRKETQAPFCALDSVLFKDFAPSIIFSPTAL